LCAYCGDEKPEHRTRLMVRTGEGDKLVEFRPGKVLNSTIEYILGPSGGAPRTKSLTHWQETQLWGIEWFPAWVAGIKRQRSAGPESELPDLREKVDLLCREYAHGARPREFAADRTRDVRTVRRENGAVFALDAFRLLEKIAPNWFGVPTKWSRISDEAKAQVEALPWFEEWLRVGKQRRDVARLRKEVPKRAKLAELHKHYTTKPDGRPAEKPSWNDCIPMQLPDGSIFEFRIATFLDDLIGNFLPGGKPGVVLDEEQKRAMRELPWVSGWIESVRTARLRRAGAGPKRSALEALDSPQKTGDEPNSPSQNADSLVDAIVVNKPVC
jgi:hypothetical protein